MSVVISAAALYALAPGCAQIPQDVIDEFSNGFYTFTSGPPSEGGDGVTWPSENSGLLVASEPQATFNTPDGVIFQNGIGNNLFFDDNYLLPDHDAVGNRLIGEALWGSPRPNFSYEGAIETVVIRIDPPAQTVSFDFIWVLASGPTQNPNAEPPADTSFVTLAVADAEPTEAAPLETFEAPLGAAFAAGAVFQESTGYWDRIELNAADHDLSQGIGFLTIFVDKISSGGASNAFAIDNFSINGATAASLASN